MLSVEGRRGNRMQSVTSRQGDGPLSKATPHHNNGNLSPKLSNHMILAVNFHRPTLCSTPSLCVHLQEMRNKQQASAPQILRGAFFFEHAFEQKEKGHPTPPNCEWELVKSAQTARLPTSAFYLPMPDSGSSALSDSFPITILMYSYRGWLSPPPLSGIYD